jgi:hypothetical protein
MAEFDFEARRKNRSEAQGKLERQQNEIDDRLNDQAQKLAHSVEKYAEGRCDIEITIKHSNVIITKKMTGMFLKLDNVLTISVDAQGTFAVKRGDYDNAVSANGQAGSLSETEMIDAVADWLGKSTRSF